MGRRRRQMVSKYTDNFDFKLLPGNIEKYHFSSSSTRSAAARQVPELLAEQVEAANVIILNKIDLSVGEQLETARMVVRSLNEKAEVAETKFGELTPDKIIGKVAVVNDHDHSHDHDCSEPGCKDDSHSHSHSHSSEECSDPGCKLSRYISIDGI